MDGDLHPGRCGNGWYCRHHCTYAMPEAQMERIAAEECRLQVYEPMSASKLVRA